MLSKLPELKPMTVATLKVARQSEFGAFLDAGTGNSDDDILLHKFQQTAPVKVGDSVEVFLYLDPKKRLTASMRVPKMKVGQIARLKVINVTDAGAFLDVGAERGIFMPFAEMFGRVKVGDTVMARLYVDEKTGRLALSMKISELLREHRENVIDFDAERILQYIRENGGATDFNDKTEPEKISETFKMSKRAFKQAIGHLLKARRIEKTDGGFKLT